MGFLFCLFWGFSFILFLAKIIGISGGLSSIIELWPLLPILVVILIGFIGMLEPVIREVILGQKLDPLDYDWNN